MGNVDQLIAYVKYFKDNYQKQISRTLRNQRNTILNLQKSQLLSGKDNALVDLSPTYDTDPFFNSDVSRRKYKELKKRKQSEHNSLKRYNLFGDKPENVPNIIVSGAYQKSLVINVLNNEIEIKGTWSRSKNIERKYPTALGLTDTSLTKLWNDYVKQDLVEYWNNGKLT